MVETTPFTVGAGAARTGGVCGKVSRAVWGMGAVDAADTRRRPGRAFGWSFTAMQ
jgi:hypothetical protein